MALIPSRHPKKTLKLITKIVLVGTLGGYFIHSLFTALSLLSWMIFTFVLSYRQFKRKSKHTYSSFTEVLLHPQIRFFLFEAIASIGLYALFFLDSLLIPSIVLLSWWLFSLNFYRHYSQFSKYD
ncbi:hypothetical protein GF336_06035 [Candidatus Woesearchaeota archaeon]|nr:hypothetical protein [Candidatus Woesearchaeota archaeon]